MMKPKERPTKLCWLDLEMTGLDPKMDKILEVAVIITDFNFNELGLYHSLVKHDSKYIEDLLKSNPFWSGRSDGLKQIVKDLQSGKDEKIVEQQLIELCEKVYKNNEQIYLAGNSIRVDRGFIDNWWPSFAAKLHYRMLDVSSFKLWWTGSGGSEFVKTEKHRALDDIRESIEELKNYTAKIKVK